MMVVKAFNIFFDLPFILTFPIRGKTGNGSFSRCFPRCIHTDQKICLVWHSVFFRQCVALVVFVIRLIDAHKRESKNSNKPAKYSSQDSCAYPELSEGFVSPLFRRAGHFLHPELSSVGAFQKGCRECNLVLLPMKTGHEDTGRGDWILQDWFLGCQRSIPRFQPSGHPHPRSYRIAQGICRYTFCSRSASAPEPSEPFSGQETHSQLLSMFGHRRPFSFAYFAPHNLSKL